MKPPLRRRREWAVPRVRLIAMGRKAEQDASPNEPQACVVSPPGGEVARPDSDLVEPLRHDDRATFIARCAAWLEDLSRRRSGECRTRQERVDIDPQDIAQEVIVKIIERWDQIRYKVLQEGYPVRGYLGSMIANCRRDRLRALRVRAVRLPTESMDLHRREGDGFDSRQVAGPAPEDRREAVEGARRKLGVVDRLPRAKDRLILKLFYVGYGVEPDFAEDELTWSAGAVGMDVGRSGAEVLALLRRGLCDECFSLCSSWFAEAFGMPGRSNLVDQWLSRARRRLLQLAAEGPKNQE